MESQCPDDATIRELVSSDYNYIISTWLRELRANDHSPLNDTEWFSAHRAFVNRCLGSSAVVVNILCAKDDPHEILAYIVGINNQGIIWVHTKRAFRNMGLATILIKNVCPLNPMLAFKTRSSRLLHGRLRPTQIRQLIV